MASAPTSVASYSHVLPRVSNSTSCVPSDAVAVAINRVSRHPRSADRSTDVAALTGERRYDPGELDRLQWIVKQDEASEQRHAELGVSNHVVPERDRRRVKVFVKKVDSVYSYLCILLKMRSNEFR